LSGRASQEFGPQEPDGLRLSAFLDQRVRATGTVMKKAEPMELKMDVGQSNQMALRVDGGYYVVTIGAAEKTAAKSTR
jgi:hypothetical protein